MNSKMFSWRRPILLCLALVCLCTVTVSLKHLLSEMWYISQLSASDVESQRAAALKLSELKSKRSVPVLLSMLTHEARQSREIVVGGQEPRSFVHDALVKLGTLSMQGLFSSLCSAREDLVIEYIILTLRDMGEVAVPLLFRAAELPQDSARRNAINALWFVKRGGSDWDVVIALAEDLVARDRCIEVRSTAAAVLGRIGPPAAHALPILSK